MKKLTKHVSVMLLAGSFGFPIHTYPASRTEIMTAQTVNEKVSGTVEDTSGAVIGASVMVKGSTNGTITDVDGKFILSDVKKGDIIQVSYIGYVTQEIKYTGESTLKITMKEDTETLDEVIVVGYGTQKKVNLTGSVSQITGEVLENRPITNIGQGLQGAIPSLIVNVGGGAPGQSSTFKIRGNTSSLSNKDNDPGPLVLVDNVQMDPNLLNPDDVESISVLKDAASSAIYGARAAYGVVLITTKKGKLNSKPKITLSASGYWQSPAKTMHNVNSMEFMTMKNIANRNSGGSGDAFDPKTKEMIEAYYNGTYKYPEYYDDSLDKNGKWIYCGNTDWFDELYKKSSFSQQYNVGVNGGNDKTTYYMSMGFADQNGLLKASDDQYRKFNVNINIASQITKWMQVSGKITHTYSTEQHPTGSDNSGVKDMGGMLKNDLSPLMPVRHGHTGRLVADPTAGAINDPSLGISSAGGYRYVEEYSRYYAGQGGNTNPVAVADWGGQSNYKKNDLWMTGALKLTPLEGLVINADYTFNVYNRGDKKNSSNFYDYTAIAGTEGYYPWTNPSSAKFQNWEDYYTALNVFAEYSKTIAQDHNFRIMVGYNQEYKHSKTFWASRSNLIDNSLTDLDLATGDKSMSSSETHWGVNGYFARLNYNWKQRYLLELNGRIDGSSRYAKGNRYSFFPSVSAAWRISEENFWSPLKSWWNSMKVRASYGSLGNQNAPSEFPYLLTYGVDSNYGYLLGGNKPVIIKTPGLVAADLTWETVNQMNFGFDAGFMDERLTTSFDWYRRNTNDMLVAGQALPAVLGASTPSTNSANMKTIGWDLSIAWNDRLSCGLNYWAKLSLFDSWSEITKYKNNPNGMLKDKDGNELHREGKKLGEIWGYTSNGLFQSDEEAAQSNQAILWAGQWAAGDVKFEDLNNNGKIDKGSNTVSDPGDQRIIGNNTPRYNFGITVGFDYKGFDFEMFWQGVGKRDYMAGGTLFWGFTSPWDTPYKSALDYWTTENRDAYFPRPGWGNGGNRVNSDRYLQSAAYGRLKNLTLGYTIPSAITNKAGISKLRVYITGENLFTITSMNDSFDPETLNGLTYPISRKIAVGLNLAF